MNKPGTLRDKWIANMRARANGLHPPKPKQKPETGLRSALRKGLPCGEQESENGYVPVITAPKPKS